MAANHHMFGYEADQMPSEAYVMATSLRVHISVTYFESDDAFQPSHC